MSKINRLHDRNKHNGEYDFEKLISSYPPLSAFVEMNKYGNLSIDFFNSEAVKALNKSLLIAFYGVEYWDIPKNSLCPPIPSRADYVHYAADLVGSYSARCFDVGVGANCIYPIIGCSEYDWRFVGSDVDPQSLANAQMIIDNNAILRNRVELRLQNDLSSIFRGVVNSDEYFDISICNPPFHSSKEEAECGTLRKLSNLKGERVTTTSLNFGGTGNELWCEGGEVGFTLRMIDESHDYRENFGWFTTLVSNEDSLKPIRAHLRKIGVKEHCRQDMCQGNKVSRIMAWRYF